MFDMGQHLDELRCRPTKWLLARRDELVREQRRLRVEELAVTRVLDERGQVDESLAGRDGVSCRTARETVETARALESLPHVAAAAHAGELSDSQLAAVVQLADEESDAEWARRAPNVAPGDLARLARGQRKPTVEESRRRREARYLRMWWRKDTGMLGFAGELPDLDGARFEKTINTMIDRIRPPRGEAWDTRDHRGADALVELCRNFEQVEVDTTAAPQPLLVVEVPEHGPAAIAGIPLPDAMIESLRDGHCRWPGCERRTGLQIHHLIPRSWGGGDQARQPRRRLHRGRHRPSRAPGTSRSLETRRQPEPPRRVTPRTRRATESRRSRGTISRVIRPALR
jgi:hypothetical protein